MLLALSQVERMMRICGRLAACIANPRDPSRVVDRREDIRARNAFQGESLRLGGLYGFGPRWPAFSLIVPH
jgi:hypothetical protein